MHANPRGAIEREPEVVVADQEDIREFGCSGGSSSSTFGDFPQYQVGDAVEVYSPVTKAWVSARVTAISGKKITTQYYGPQGGKLQKKLSADGKQIRPAPAANLKSSGSPKSSPKNQHFALSIVSEGSSENGDKVKVGKSGKGRSSSKRGILDTAKAAALSAGSGDEVKERGPDGGNVQQELNKFREVMSKVGVPGDSAEQLEAFLAVLMRGVTEMEAEQAKRTLDQKASTKQLTQSRQKLEEAEETVSELKVKLRHENADTRAASAERRLQKFLTESPEGRYCLMADKIAQMTREMKEEKKKWEEKLEEKDEVIETLQDLLRKHKDFIRKEESEGKSVGGPSVNLMDDY